jgi:uncharacterized protein YyaL (SSP411 family)
MEQKARRSNRLIAEKSPYLLQHAFNPVDWYPWGEEAFARARREDKPIFLSVGYSTCHWCHVMERESFEDEEVAALLNQFFVPVKVDREERPDVDGLYMAALQAMGQDGGWPMSMFLTPEREPFWGGTYFPPVARQGRAGFPEILQRVHEIWISEREKVMDAAGKLTVFLRDSASAGSVGERASAGAVEKCYQQLEQTFDREHGGFGQGPKFPRPVAYGFLLRYARRSPVSQALPMVEKTLASMAAGGIYDHVGGGFHRYAVDRKWRVPHFEKMLYDQAQLVSLYLEAFQQTKNPSYARIVRETCDYVLRDLRHPEGGFYSAEDADSPLQEGGREKGEGAFYVWTEKEVRDTVGDEAELFCTVYGVESGGNVPIDPQGEFNGKNILYLPESLQLLAHRLDLEILELETRLGEGRRKLLEVRELRPRPIKDDKILASWNGLMIGAMAGAGVALGEERYVRGARRAAGFVLSHLFDPWGHKLFRRFRDGEARHTGNLDDYAFLIGGLVDLYEATGEIPWLRGAIRMTEDMLSGFWDGKRGGFFDSPSGDDSILVRLKNPHDGAEPSGNAMAAMSLLRMSEMTGNQDWRRRAEETFALFAAMIEHRPVVMPFMIAALDRSLGKPTQVVIAGAPGSQGRGELIREVFSTYLPDKIVLYADGAGGGEEMAEMLPFMKGMVPIGGKAAGYVCRDFVCKLPTNDPELFGRLLGGPSNENWLGTQP